QRPIRVRRNHRPLLHRRQCQGTDSPPRRIAIHRRPSVQHLLDGGRRRKTSGGVRQQNHSPFQRQQRASEHENRESGRENRESGRENRESKTRNGASEKEMTAREKT